MPKPKKERTPEEEEQVRQAQTFIQQREKLASQQGISSKQAGRALIPEEEAKAAKEQQASALEKLQPKQVAELEQIPETIKSILNPVSASGGPLPNPKTPLGIGQASTIRDIIEATGGDVGKFDKIQNTATTTASIAGGVGLAAAAPSIAGVLGAGSAPVLASSGTAIAGTLGKIGKFGKLVLGVS